MAGPIENLREMLNQHDIIYMYSDDIGVYRQGRASAVQIDQYKKLHNIPRKVFEALWNDHVLTGGYAYWMINPMLLGEAKREHASHSKPRQPVRKR